MSTQTSIEWTEVTWNPTVGCSKISPGCAHGYAEVMARRLQAMKVKGYENGFKLTLLPHRLDEPLNRIRPNVAFFFKQWGSWGADGQKWDNKKNGRLLEGRTWGAVPVEHLYCSPTVEIA